RFSQETHITIAVSAYQEKVRQAFSKRGLMTYAREREALQVLDVLSRYSVRRQKAQALINKPAARCLSLPVVGASSVLDEACSLDLLPEARINTVPHRLCKDATEDVEAAEAFAGAVVLKGCSPDILHKSEH